LAEIQSNPNVDNSTKEKIKNRVVVSIGINLIPPVTEGEIILEDKKSSFNLSGAIAILIFVVISGLIFGYNALTKLELNNAKTSLKASVDGVTVYSDIVSMNEEMIKRISIFDQVQKNTISYKGVFDYWKTVAQNSNSINSIKLSSDLGFSVSGNANSLTDVSKMWHLLSTDSRVLTINLKSVGAGSSNVSYEFEGKLDYNYFKSLKLSE
jgi:hypothetical protein